MQLKPTDEQATAVELAAKGNNLTIQALAGTGKTTTLKLIGQRLTPKRGIYLSFNKEIATEAGKSFPRNVSCGTVHSLALKSIGAKHGWIRERLNDSRRQKSAAVADLFDIESINIECWLTGKSRTFKPVRLAGMTLKMVQEFCRSADEHVKLDHFPLVKGLDRPGQNHNSRFLAKYLLPFAQQAWQDLSSAEGSLQFKHEHYLKLWQLTDPQLPFDFAVVDEAQDLNPTMSQVLTRQKNCQLIVVGDSRQQIYEWNGAINALGQFSGETVWLTSCFRFGQEIADVANYILRLMGDSAKLKGAGGPSVVTKCETPEAIICRTNWATYLEILRAQESARKVYLAGNKQELIGFAKACESLQRGVPSQHPELAGFDTWGELIQFVKEDDQGSEIAPMLNLIEKLGISEIIRALEKTENSPDSADITISTCHKSKGKDWGKVRLNRDLIKIDSEHEEKTGIKKLNMTPSELRLLYVGVTRAKNTLDISDLHGFVEKVTTTERQVSSPARLADRSMERKPITLVAETSSSYTNNVQPNARWACNTPDCTSRLVSRELSWRYCPNCGQPLKKILRRGTSQKRQPAEKTKKKNESEKTKLETGIIKNDSTPPRSIDLVREQENEILSFNQRCLLSPINPRLPSIRKFERVLRDELPKLDHQQQFMLRFLMENREGVVTADEIGKSADGDLSLFDGKFGSFCQLLCEKLNLDGYEEFPIALLCELTSPIRKGYPWGFALRPKLADLIGHLQTEQTTDY